MRTVECAPIRLQSFSSTTGAGGGTGTGGGTVAGGEKSEVAENRVRISGFGGAP